MKCIPHARSRRRLTVIDKLVKNYEEVDNLKSVTV